MEKETLTRILYYGDLSPDSKQFIQNLVDKKDKEIERLNNIIDELEKELNIAYKELMPNELVNGRNLIKNIQIGLKELESKGE